MDNGRRWLRNSVDHRSWFMLDAGSWWNVESELTKSGAILRHLRVTSRDLRSIFVIDHHDDPRCPRKESNVHPSIMAAVLLSPGSLPGMGIATFSRSETFLDALGGYRGSFLDSNYVSPRIFRLGLTRPVATTVLDADRDYPCRLETARGASRLLQPGTVGSERTTE